MSKFMITLDKAVISQQVAALVNSGRQLHTHLTPHYILTNPITYLIEISGGRIIGVIGIEQVRPNVTEIKHLCVDPAFRGHGLGRKLLNKAVATASTPLVYGLVRSDNLVNIRNNIRIGMRPIGKKKGYGPYSLIIFAKDKTKNRRAAP
jgi:RimJ/RimL family protein N-acetyltransferase